MLIKFAPASVASALARRVFPVPGGPKSNIPLQGWQKLQIITNWNSKEKDSSVSTKDYNVKDIIPATSSHEKKVLVFSLEEWQVPAMPSSHLQEHLCHQT